MECSSFALVANSKEVGRYRANIVTYAIAKVAHDAQEQEKVIDLGRIWRLQDVPTALETALLVAGAEAQQLITNPPEGVRNMSEWAKKQACWEQFRKRDISYPEEFFDMLVDPEEEKTENREITEDESLTKGVEAQTKVFELGAPHWSEAKTWGRTHKLLSPSEFGVLDVCSKMPTRFPTEKQTLFALEVLQKLEENGFSLTEETVSS